VPLARGERTGGTLQRYVDTLSRDHPDTVLS
jgi:hypothetical protein